MRAAAALVTAATAAREDRLAGRDYTDLVEAVAPEIEALFADGRTEAVVTLLGVAELAIRRSALHRQSDPVRECRRLLRSFAGAYGVDLPAGVEV